MKTEEEKNSKENYLSEAEPNIKTNLSSLEHSCEELFGENFLLGAEPDLVKKPCENVFEIIQEDKFFWQIHKVQKQKNKYASKSTSRVHIEYLLGKEYIDLEIKVLSYIFLNLNFLLSLSSKPLLMLQSSF